MNGQNQKKDSSSKKMTALLVALGVFIFLGVVALVVVISMLVINNGAGGLRGTTAYVLTEASTEAQTNNGAFVDNYQISDFIESVQSENDGDGADIQIPNNNQSTPSPVSPNGEVTAGSDKAANDAAGQQLYEDLNSIEKNGDNILSDDAENEFIALVSSRYGVDAEKLVAIYSVPDSGTNFVLQFNGEKDADGKIVKSPDTLEKVYNIDKKRNVKIATGKMLGNVGIGYAESALCVGMVKEALMPQYPDYFRGVEDKRK